MAPPLPTPSGVVRFRMGHVIDNAGPYTSGFDLSYTGSGLTPAQLAACAGVVANAWSTDLAGACGTWVTLTSVVAVDLQNPSTPEGVVAVSHAGTRTGGGLLTSTATCLSFLPNRRYRGSRPKTFLPAGVYSDLLSQQHWSSTWITDIENAWGLFIAAIIANSPSGVTLGAQVYVSYIGRPYTVVSNAGKTRSHSVGTPVDPPGVYSVLSVVANPKVASQRKRLGKPF